MKAPGSNPGIGTNTEWHMSSENKKNKSDNNMGVGLKNKIDRDGKHKRSSFYTASDRQRMKRDVAKEVQDDFNMWADDDD